MFERVPVYLRTLRHLRWEQVFFRASRKVRRINIKSPTEDLTLRRAKGKWPLPPTRPDGLYRGNGSFEFLHSQGQIDELGEWRVPGRDMLWQYNLHYFDELNSVSATPPEVRHTLVRHWIQANPPGTDIAWDPYPLSLRIVNWIKWCLRNESVSPAVARSLYEQVSWLYQDIEYHLLANHLFANLKALLFASVFFDGREAAEWGRKVGKLFLRELGEQILQDGGHFERSPMYHLIILEDLLDLAALRQIYGLPQEWIPGLDAKILAMVAWARRMCHGDGGPALFNDSALNVAPDYRMLGECLSRLGLGGDESGALEMGDAVLFQESGFLSVLRGDMCLLADVGTVGPSYQPGHAHAGTLSFELSRRGRRIFVNTGTSSYHDAGIRRRERSTAAHNTIVIDERDSSEVWSSFRVGRRARASVLGAKLGGDDISVCATHDGYRWLTGKPIHRRTWKIEGRSLVIVDDVDGHGRHDIDLHYHFASDLKLRIEHDERKVFVLDATDSCVAEILFATSQEQPFLLEEKTFDYAPEFGRRVPAQALTVRASRVKIPVSFSARIIFPEL